jgi:Domain of unknown function (DUF4276)
MGKEYPWCQTMSKRVLVLVEGQTEERFVKDVLSPAFFSRDLYFSPTILVTKRVKNGPNFKGGVTNFAKFRNDTQRLLNSSGDAMVTTILDYYGLPDDFPGMDTRPDSTPVARVTHVESALFSYFGSPANFIPFLVLHEFEALLFSSSEVLPRVLTENRKQPQFAAIRASVHTPEDINERPELAPSKRIVALFPAYKKTLHGPMAAGRIGLDKIRAECPHFSSWIARLEAYAAS